MSGSFYNIGQGTEPAFFIRGPSAFSRFVFFSVLSLAFIAVDSRLDVLKAVRHQLELFIHPLVLMVNAPSQLYREADTYLTAHHHLLDENKALKKILLKSKVDAQTIKALKVENINLRNLFNMKRQIVQPSIPSEILHASSDQLTKKLVINRGEHHTVKIGAAVVDAKGIIGQVTSVYDNTSIVTLITDQTMVVPVMVERNGLRAIAFGNGSLLEIPYLPGNVDINPGDKLTTSGIDSVYPAGIAVGVVRKVAATPGSSFIRVICAPAGGVDYHSQVLVINPTGDVIVPKEPTKTEMQEKTVPKAKETNHLSAQGKVKHLANKPINTKVQHAAQ